MNRLISILLAAVMIVTSFGFVKAPEASAAEAEKQKIGGYLAAFTAKYEPNMGLEFAQFPSKEYTNTFRTDVMFYALSKDGKTYEEWFTRWRFAT